MNLQLLRERLRNDEASCWAQIQQLRAEVEADNMELMMGASIDASLRFGDPIKFATKYLQQVLELLLDNGYSFDEMDPGHGPGHLMRDYVNAIRLFARDEILHRGDVTIGIVAGMMHDLACALIYRYDDPKRAVRHAEAGALLFLEVSEELPPIGSEIRMAIAYAIAAHTHYLRESEVQCADGVTRKIMPYVDTYENGEPVMPVWVPRWIDRLDLCGPTIVGRHFLTLGRDHHDFSNALGFKPAKFDAQMRPLLRPAEEIKQDPDGPTILEHIRMLVMSQNNDSPYGKFDNRFPRMVELRDQNVKAMRSVLTEFEIFSYDLDVEESIMANWEEFLGETIEPSKLGKESARELSERVRALPPEVRTRIITLFDLTMREYTSWATSANYDIRGRVMKLPGIATDVSETLRFPKEAATV